MPRLARCIAPSPDTDPNHQQRKRPQRDHPSPYERIRQIEAKALRKMRHPTRIRQLHGFLEIEDLELQAALVLRRD